MNETTLQIWRKIQEAFLGLSIRKRLWLSLSTVVLAGIGLIALFVLGKDPYVLLYSELQAEEARGVVRKLSELGIPSEISENQSTVSVPGSKVHQARLQLAKEGLPSQDLVGFEKFDGSTLGMSSYVQRIHYVRAVQGELVRTVQRLASVKRARVHLSIPPKKTFLEEQEPPKASVVLELRRGMRPTKSEIQGIAHLIASAVEGLKVSQVSIVDTEGGFLHRPDESEASALSTTLLEVRRSLETEYERRIEEILTPVVGVGKVRAKVVVEVDPSRVNTTEETFDSEKTAIRASSRNEETSQGARNTAGGTPGSRSNLPGPDAVAQQQPTSSSTTEKNNQSTNFAVPRKVLVIDKPSGDIKRVTVAVLVDGTYAAGKEGAPPVFTPRAEPELKRIQELVSNAVGYDPQRRDSVTVSSMPFQPAAEIVSDVEPPAERPFWHKPAATGGAGIVVLLLAYLMVVRPLRKWTRIEPARSAEAVALPRTVAEIEAEQERLAAEAAARAADVVAEGEPQDKREQAELSKRILEKLIESPKKGIRIVQDWMDDEPSAVLALEEGAA